MTVYNELKCLFYQELKDTFDVTPFNGEFTTIIFNSIENEQAPRFYLDVCTKLDNLSAACNFDRNARMFFLNINAIRRDCRPWKHGHVPNDAEVTQSCIRAMYAFVHRKDAYEAD